MLLLLRGISKLFGSAERIGRAEEERKEEEQRGRNVSVGSGRGKEGKTGGKAMERKGGEESKEID